jgi:hypothetical protein
VLIDMAVPGAELVVGRDPPERVDHADVYVAVSDAFRAARRELMEFAARVQGKVKVHAEPPPARPAS